MKFNSLFRNTKHKEICPWHNATCKKLLFLRQGVTRKSFDRREKIGEKHPVPTPGVGRRPKAKRESVLLEPKGLYLVAASQPQQIHSRAQRRNINFA